MSEDRSLLSELTEKDISEILAHPYRRYILYYVHFYANPVGLADIAHQITIWETNEPADEKLQERLTIYHSLYHDHLPKLSDAGVIEYDQEEDVVELGRAAEQLVLPLEDEFHAEVVDLLEAERCTFTSTE